MTNDGAAIWAVYGGWRFRLRGGYFLLSLAVSVALNQASETLLIKTLH